MTRDGEIEITVSVTRSHVRILVHFGRAGATPLAVVDGIVANRPGMAGTVPDIWALSRRCPGRGKIPTMSRNLRSPSASTRLDGHCSPTVSSLVLFDTHNANKNCSKTLFSREFTS